ncbi:MAG: hypothetical protein ACRC8S_05990 [Fimbriiglobus sp.]
MHDVPKLRHAAYGLQRIRCVSWAILLAPTIILASTAVGYDSGLALIGAISTLIGAACLVRYAYAWRPPASGLVILLYLVALGWLWIVTRHEPTASARLGKGILLLGAVGLLIGHDLIRTGLEPRRRAREYSRRLQRRTFWPTQEAEFAAIPEVRVLMDVLEHDPTPAAELLTDDRMQVRMAAFVALQQRNYWRRGEAEMVLNAIQKTQDPPTRAAGIRSLQAMSDGDLLGVVAGYLRDRSPEVRAATLQTLLAHHDTRWPIIRDSIRDALADPHFAKDGPMHLPPDSLSGVAICDLVTWSAEAAPLGDRALQTLMAHYAIVLQTGTEPALPGQLCQQITNTNVPPQMRVELASLMHKLGMITPDLLDRMTDADQPGPVRLLAAEMLLAWNKDNPDALDVLRGLGRQSNRETALAIARLLQKYLHVDMGLPTGGAATNTKQAAEVTKRVLMWASGKAPPTSAHQDAGSAWVDRPLAAPALPGLKQTNVPFPPDNKRR